MNSASERSGAWRACVIRHLHGERCFDFRSHSGKAENARGGIFGVEFVDEGAPVVEDGALVERAFVGDFAVIERRRLVEEDGALDAIRGAG